jgi:hypothetical protein
VCAAYPEDLVFLSDVLDWILKRATSVPPFAFHRLKDERYVAGRDADAELHEAIDQGRLAVFRISESASGALLGRDQEQEAHWTQGRVASRAAVLALWPDPHIAGVPMRDQYTLLWDAAARMSGADGYTSENNWLRLVDEFWRGNLPLVYFPPNQLGASPIACDRELLSQALCIGIDDLRCWSISDYCRSLLCRHWVKCDPEGRFGLAALTADIVAYRKRTAQEDAPPAASIKVRRSTTAKANGASRPKGRTGPAPEKRNAVKQKLICMARAGQDWSGVKRVSLAMECGVSRSTLTDAMAEATEEWGVANTSELCKLLVLSEIETPTNTDTK